jgi:hypothetical protein
LNGQKEVKVASVDELKDKKKWLALEDDFRTLGIGQIVAGLPQFDLILHSGLPT